MSNNLDLPLDEIIKLNKQSKGGGRGGGGGGGGGRRGRGAGRRGGGSFRGSGRGSRTSSYLRPRRPSAFQIAKSIAARRTGLFDDLVGPTLGLGTKLQISNLDYGVSNEDIKELFSEMGELKHCGIHYDKSGRSEGTAVVVFVRRSDALAAIKRYNNVQLDGKPMKIELVSTNPVNTAGRGAAAVGRGRPAASLRGRGRGFGLRGFRGRGRGRGWRGSSKVPSVAELDADLEKYHKDAMEM